MRTQGVWLLSTLLLTSLGALGGCGDAAESSGEQVTHNAVKVKIDGPLATIDKLRLSVSVDGRPFKKLADVDVKNVLALLLPERTSGKLAVQIDGISSQRWIVASGNGVVDVAPGQVGLLHVTLKSKDEGCFPGWTCMTPVPRPETIQAIWAFTEEPTWKAAIPSDTPIWTLGNHALFQQWDGDLWRSLPAIPGVGDHQLTSITMSAKDDLWVAAPQPSPPLAYHFDGSQWKDYNVSARKLWSAGLNDVWGIDLQSISHWDGGPGWTDKKPGVLSVQAEFHGVGGSGPSDVWVVGNVVLHGTASGLKQEQLPPTTMHAVWVDPQSKTVWMAGRNGTIVRAESPYTTGWESVANPLGYSYLYALSGSSSDLWVAGDNGSIAHWNGSQWLSVPSGVSTGLRTISVRSSRDVWFGGEDGTVLHWNGGAIEKRAGGLPNLKGIWGTATDNL